MMLQPTKLLSSSGLHELTCRPRTKNIKVNISTNYKQIIYLLIGPISIYLTDYKQIINCDLNVCTKGQYIHEKTDSGNVKSKQNN